MITIVDIIDMIHLFTTCDECLYSNLHELLCTYCGEQNGRIIPACDIRLISYSCLDNGAW